ncbi:MAG TPA: hypothetical protein VEB43_12585 [Anaeromyxobacter sp.]|nr:hypothetical protein [Anaeromyxobacter sp.]
MDELRVPKHRVAAEVFLPGAAPRRIALFLAEAAPDHDGPERPLDLLNGRADFLPALDEASGEMTFLHRAALSAVRVARAAEPEDLPTIPTEHEVELLLSDGAVLRGIVSYVRPAAHARLVDFLNEPTPFLRLVEEDAVTLVNKRHVARVALLTR